MATLATKSSISYPVLSDRLFPALKSRILAAGSWLSHFKSFCVARGVFISYGCASGSAYRAANGRQRGHFERGVLSAPAASQTWTLPARQVGATLGYSVVFSDPQRATRRPERAEGSREFQGRGSRSTASVFVLSPASLLSSRRNRSPVGPRRVPRRRARRSDVRGQVFAYRGHALSRVSGTGLRNMLLSATPTIVEPPHPSTHFFPFRGGFPARFRDLLGSPAMPR